MTQFEKYHGLGNDFVVVEVEDPSQFSRDLAKQICDRHFGVGADGVLLLSPHDGARARMTVINRDGSHPEMCGNGLRCAVLHLARQKQETDVAFDVFTDAGLLRCELQGDSEEAWVRISLGKAERQGTLEFPTPSGDLTFYKVSMGNPHAVVFGHDFDAAQIDELAPRVSSRFPHGANIEFAKRLGEREFDLVVHERGVGRTLACGTGAGATAVAAIESGLAKVDEPIQLHLPGGRLEIVVRPDFEVSLAGPARHVFSGVLSPLQ